MRQAKTICVTGGTGFLGAHVVRELLRAAYRVVVIKRRGSSLQRLESVVHDPRLFFVDIEDGLESVIEQYRPFAIIHLATLYGRTGEDPADILAVNMVLPTTLLMLAHRFKVKAFLNADTFFHEQMELSSGERSYTVCKKNFLALGKQIALADGAVKFLNFRIEQMYGPHDRMEKFLGMLVAALGRGVRRLRLTAGRQKRDFIFVSDVARAFVLALRSVPRLGSFEEFGIGTGQSTSIKSVAETVRKLMGSDTKFQWGAIPYRKGEIMDSKANLANNKKIHWRAETSLVDGLSQLIV